jgi:hypothetical protein
MSRLETLIDRLETLPSVVNECSEYKNELIILLYEIEYSAANEEAINTYVDDYYLADSQTWHWMNYDWIDSKKMFKAIAVLDE